ncbi:MAG: RluA family pseudouridine synthase [Phycisphaerales bacterium]|nr:RluA family pseudouridine synthase [Phycisphaerales bacterium]
MTAGPHHEPEAARRRVEDSADDTIVGGGLILPGGKVDAEALRKLAETTGEETDDDAELRRVTFTLQRDLQKRLDRYLADRIGFMSRNQLQKVIAEGGVLVNDRIPKSSTVLRKGDVVEVVVPPPPARNIQPEDIPLDVMYEDDFLIVLNKSPDIIVHPARSHLKGTMLSALAFHFQKRASGALSKVGADFARPGVVHRLDRHTSGCIVFAKQDETHWKLGHQFEHRRVDKRYLAVVHGRVEPPVDVIDLPIGPHPSREKGYREKYVVRHDELGKPAVTICRVREYYDLTGAAIGKDRASGSSAAAPGWRPASRDPHHPPARASESGLFSLVELELKTGRTHQIRVHLSHSGHPIVGDDMYGGNGVGRNRAGPAGLEVLACPNGEPPPEFDPIICRQSLHACVLGFTHPISEKPMVFTAPVRGDIAELIRELRRASGPRLERPDAPGATVDLARAIPDA